MMAHTQSSMLICLVVIYTASIRTASAAVCPDAKQTLELHNVYRRAHDADPLTWYQPAVDKAQSVAQGLAANGCQLQHSSMNGGMGENLYFSAGTKTKCTDAVNMWYSEEPNYNYDTPTPYTTNAPNFVSWSHFTQMVWRDTYGVGCAMAQGDNCVVVVCEYQKMGNDMSDEAFAKNVRSKADSAVTAAVKMSKKLKINNISLLSKRRRLMQAGPSMLRAWFKPGAGMRKMLKLQQ